MSTSVPPFTEPDQVSHGDREVIARWIIGAADEEGCQPQAVLSVRHVKGFGYRAALNTAQVRTTPQWQEDAFDPSRSTVIHNVRTARFSTTGLRAAYEAALTELRRRVDEQAVQAHFPTDSAGSVDDTRASRSPRTIIASVVDNLVDGDLFSVDGGTTWYVCAVVLFGTVSVYTTPQRGDHALTIRVEAGPDDPCLLIIT